MTEAVRIRPEMPPAEQPADVHASPTPDRYFRLGDSVLRQVRADMIAADAAWRRKRVELVDRTRDELLRIDHDHEAELARLKTAIARLEAMRGI